ncbi:beta-ketoacyl synthase N-terminal-like domain-containing protein [Streptomyces sp. NPDC086182]|uniref:beta-ketoacyl synthase N-terminal-like domain-containing protein n=1 Tax=Streptomyces sp. NPDC086182 TaxID=3155058 RepID=UPI00342FF098
MLRGDSGIRRITRFDPSGYSAELAGEIPEYEPSAHLPSRLLPQTDRMTRLALIAAEEALTNADATPKDMPAFACGVVTSAESPR